MFDQIQNTVWNPCSCTLKFREHEQKKNTKCTYFLLQRATMSNRGLHNLKNIFKFLFTLSAGLHLRTNRSSPPEAFLGKGVLKIWSKFIWEHPCRNVISIKLLCFWEVFSKTFSENLRKFFRKKPVMDPLVYNFSKERSLDRCIWTLSKL